MQNNKTDCPIISTSQVAPQSDVFLNITSTDNDSLGLNKPLVQDVENHEVEELAPIKERGCSIHFRSLIITILLWTSITFLTIQMLKKQREGVEPPNFPLYCVGVGLMVLIYYIECFFAATGRFVKNKRNLTEIQNHLNDVVAADGNIRFHVTCYHYETRTKTVYYTDSEGRSQSRTETYQEMVVTHRASGDFYFKRCEDRTGKIVIYFEKLTRLQLNTKYDFANSESRAAYERQKANFKLAHDFDDYQTFREEFKIRGLEKRVLIVPPGARVPGCMSIWMYILFSMIGLSFFYRLWFQEKTHGKDISIVKIFHC